MSSQADLRKRLKGAEDKLIQYMRKCKVYLCKLIQNFYPITIPMMQIQKKFGIEKALDEVTFRMAAADLFGVPMTDDETLFDDPRLKRLVNELGSTLLQGSIINIIIIIDNILAAEQTVQPNIGQFCSIIEVLLNDFVKKDKAKAKVADPVEEDDDLILVDLID